MLIGLDELKKKKKKKVLTKIQECAVHQAVCATEVLEAIIKLYNLSERR